MKKKSYEKLLLKHFLLLKLLNKNRCISNTLKEKNIQLDKLILCHNGIRITLKKSIATDKFFFVANLFERIDLRLVVNIDLLNGRQVMSILISFQ